MSTFLTALFTVLIFVLVFILIGLFLMSRLVGGFGNLRAIYRLFTGKGRQGARQQSAKSSSSRRASHASAAQGRSAQQKGSSGGKMFGENEGTYVDFEEVK